MKNINLFNTRIYPYNLLIIFYVVLLSFALFEYEIELVLYLLWIKKSDIILFIWFPIVPFCIQLYLKVKNIGFESCSYLKVFINFVFMMIVSYLIFAFVFFEFYYKGEAV